MLARGEDRSEKASINRTGFRLRMISLDKISALVLWLLPGVRLATLLPSASGPTRLNSTFRVCCLRFVTALAKHHETHDVTLRVKVHMTLF